MAKKKSGKLDFGELKRREPRKPEICPHCYEEGVSNQIGVSDLYRCGACGKTYAFGHFYDAWLKGHLSAS